jgi:hypothetical protein
MTMAWGGTFDPPCGEVQQDQMFVAVPAASCVRSPDAGCSGLPPLPLFDGLHFILLGDSNI